MPSHKSMSSSNSKSMLSMPKSKYTCAIICGVVLAIAIFVALYYMNKANKNTEYFNEMSNKLPKDMSNKLPKGISNNKTLEAFTHDDNSIKPSAGECVVVLFYAEWCGHCKTFKPHYDKATQELNGKKDKNGDTLRLEMVDCDEHKDLAAKYDVSGYPTVKILKENSVREYNGERTYEGLRKYLVSNE